MKSILLIVCFSMLLTILGCGKGPFYSFGVENNADYDIVLHIEFFKEKHFYPDTLFSIDKPGGHLIKAHTTKNETYFWAEKWEVVIQKMPNDTMSFFFFHADTLIKYSVEILQQDYKILRRYDLSSQDFIALKNKHGNYSIIPYPPDERLKDMKMYPTYGNE